MMLVIFISIVLLCLILILLITKYYTYESFKDYDFNSDYMKNTCLDYITKEKKDWNLDYKLDDYTPEDREKQINMRRDIIANLDAVTARRFTDINRPYEYMESCILRKDRELDFVTDNNKCLLSGQILSDKLDPIDGKYGRFTVANASVQFMNVDDYKINKGFTNKNDIRPNKGCFLPLDTDKDTFFNTIDKLVSMKQFNDANQINLATTQNNKTLEENQQFIDTFKLYGMAIPQDIGKYGHSIITKCRDVSTDPINTPDWNYLSLNAVNIGCGDDEIMNRFELNKTSDNQYKIDFRCCEMRTEDNKIGFKEPVMYNTPPITNTTHSDYLEKHNINCIQPGIDPNTSASMLNYIRFDNNPQTNQSSFTYNCSSLQKDFKDDSRKISYDCKPKSFLTNPKEYGIRPLTGLVAECAFGEGISQLQVKDDVIDPNRYGLEFQCCKPSISPQVNNTPLRDRIISGSYITMLRSDLPFNELVSQDGRFKFKMQDDGNLVLWFNNRGLWSSNTNSGNGIYKAELTPSGQLVVTNQYGNFIWQSNGDDSRRGPFQLVAQNDGNVVIYGQRDGGFFPVWATNTNGDYNNYVEPTNHLISTIKNNNNYTIKATHQVQYNMSDSGRISLNLKDPAQKQVLLALSVSGTLFTISNLRSAGNIPPTNDHDSTMLTSLGVGQAPGLFGTTYQWVKFSPNITFPAYQYATFTIFAIKKVGKNVCG